MLSTKLARDLGLEVPLFAFTRSKEVVVEVSRAGGMGVLGCVAHTPEQLEADLAWIDAHVGGKPYGIDTVMPQKYAGKGENLTVDKLRAMIPPQHEAFRDRLLEHFHVPELPSDYERRGADLLGWSVETGVQQLEIALKHPIALLASALGTPPAEALDACHARGVKVAALCGKVEQAVKHAEAGVDVIVAQGTEAGGHTGEIATMVLTPAVVDAVGDRPVLAAGGIGSGRQLAAALCLGAQGGWTGSIWLTCKEHLDYVPPIVVEKLLAAGYGDTVRSRAISGKPARQLKTAWTEAWESKESPGYLPIPLMWMLQAEAVERIYHHRVAPLAGSPVGQIVGSMKDVRPAADLVRQLAADAEATLGRVLGSAS
jgi:NAD(P)H-dependent flavin oxidoreductase YrpB (nitropropane dioxygenase family)